DGGVAALGVAVAARVGGADPMTLLAAVRTGGTVPIPKTRAGGTMEAPAPVAVRAGDLWPINYVGPARSFLTVPSDVVAALAEPDAEIAADNPLRGPIAMLGGAFQRSEERRVGKE